MEDSGLRSRKHPSSRGFLVKLRRVLVLVCILTVLVEGLVFRRQWLVPISTSMLQSVHVVDTNCSEGPCQQQGITNIIATGIVSPSSSFASQNPGIPSTVEAENVISSAAKPIKGEGISLLPKCKVPAGGFKGWKQGVVTVLEPKVPVNCSKAVAEDEEEIEQVKSRLSTWNNSISDEEMLGRVQDCKWLKDYFSGNLYNTEQERLFPIAFAFIVYDSPQQVLRLLRLLYRPQNSYCIHYDVKSKFKTFFQSIADCLENVIIPSKLEDVVWGYYTVLAAQINCMTDLLRSRNTSPYKWQYVINLCGKELPLTTNREIVAQLMKLKGLSSVMAYKAPNTDEVMGRIKHPVKLNKDGTKIIVDYSTKLGTPPFDIETEYFKSQSYVALSYPFVKYISTDPTAIEIYDFFKKCKNPEEHFYATIFRRPGVPGGYNENFKMSYLLVESVFWSYAGHSHECKGKVIHNICVVGLGDLKGLLSMERNHLFHNKYFVEYDHTVMDCVEERIVQRNRLEYQQECPLQLASRG